MFGIPDGNKFEVQIRNAQAFPNEEEHLEAGGTRPFQDDVDVIAHEFEPDDPHRIQQGAKGDGVHPVHEIFPRMEEPSRLVRHEMVPAMRVGLVLGIAFLLLGHFEPPFLTFFKVGAHRW